MPLVNYQRASLCAGMSRRWRAVHIDAFEMFYYQVSSWKLVTQMNGQLHSDQNILSTTTRRKLTIVHSKVGSLILNIFSKKSHCPPCFMVANSMKSTSSAEKADFRPRPTFQLAITKDPIEFHKKPNSVVLRFVIFR